MDKLAAMQTFVRVVESGSFSAVARESGTTQSAISKQVAALEQTLGARLLTRSTRALAMTEEGARYFEQVRRLVAEVAEAEAMVLADGQRLSGWLRVAASIGYGRLRVLPLVRQFMVAYPEVKIDLRLHDGFVDIIEQGIDVAVRIGEMEDSSLIARRVGTVVRAPIASREYLQRVHGGRLPAVPAELQNYNCITHGESGALNTWRFVAGAGASMPEGSVQAVRVSGSLHTNSSDALRAAIVDGMGVGYFGLTLFEGEIASGEVLVLLPEWRTEEVPVSLVSTRERRASTKVKVFCDFVAAALAK